MPYRIFLATASVSLLAAAPAPAAFFHTADGSIQGSLCVGAACVAAEAFGDDALRLKENNTRIHFDDASIAPGFPANDWRLIANDSSIGGNSYFAIEDATAGNQVFRVNAGAPANALVVDSDGDIGIGTANPAFGLHILDGETPTIRLEQDGTGGFAPQIWDVAGNAANFFIRDMTNGGSLPFRIEPGADRNALFIAANGEIGLGTATPDGALHIRRSTAAYITLENTTSGRKWYFVHESAAGGRFIITRDDAGPNSMFLGADGSLQVGGNGSAGNGMVLAANGNLTIGGNLTQNSDKNSKMAIEPVDADDILAKVTALPVSAWTYKTEAEAGIRHIGPMAQDFYALFGTGATETGISSIDSSGVALAAIQALVAQNDAQRAQNEELSLQVAALSLRLNMLEGLAAE